VRGLGLTTLITLHDLNLAAAYCDRLYLLADGRIVAAGPTAEVLTADHLRRIFKVKACVGRHPLTGRLQLSFASLQ
jgi:iron complex transport system ATP-binding protein